jgi:hypothetical protein
MKDPADTRSRIPTQNIKSLGFVLTCQTFNAKYPIMAVKGQETVNAYSEFILEIELTKRCLARSKFLSPS